MDDAEAKVRLAEMQAMTFPPAEVDVSTYTAEDAEKIRAHFARFMAPRDTCPCCGGPGYWQWVIVHGVGECVSCSYPVMVYHYVKLADGSRPRVLTRALYYQPGELTCGGDDV